VGNIGTTNLALGEYGEALKWTRKGLSLAPTVAFSYSNVGYLYGCLGDYAEAERWLYKALELQPDFHYPHREFVYLYLSQGKFDKAREHSEKALALAPDEVDSFIWAGDVELYSGRLSLARQYYEKARQLCGAEMPGITGIVVNSCLGYIYSSENRGEEAQEAFGRALELGRKLADAGDESRQLPYYMACINAVLGRKEEAHSWLSKAVGAGWRDYRLAALDPLLTGIREDEQYKITMAVVRGMIDQMRRRAEKEQ
jgi:tetratricopeptide (TPR) repeat protein